MTWMALAGFSRAKQRHAKSPIREIGVQGNGLLELGYGLLMLALEGQHLSEVGMSDREIGVELNRLPSEADARVRGQRGSNDLHPTD